MSDAPDARVHERRMARPHGPLGDRPVNASGELSDDHPNTDLPGAKASYLVLNLFPSVGIFNACERDVPSIRLGATPRPNGHFDASFRSPCRPSKSRLQVLASEPAASPPSSNHPFADRQTSYPGERRGSPHVRRAHSPRQSKTYDKHSHSS